MRWDTSNYPFKKWFAWKPIDLYGTSIKVWLEFVERRYNKSLGGWYEYRDIACKDSTVQEGK